MCLYRATLVDSFKEAKVKLKNAVVNSRQVAIADLTFSNTGGVERCFLR